MKKSSQKKSPISNSRKPVRQVKKARSPKFMKPSEPMVGLSSFSGMSRSMSNAPTRIRGSDLIYNVTGVSAAPVSIRVPCNPRFWPGTKAYQESLGFQCYCPKSITVQWRPALAATTAGLVVGGSFSAQQQVIGASITNALLAVPGSQAGPVWRDLSFKMDLSVLTQPRYFLNTTGDDGVPTDVLILLPSTAVGLIEVLYEIEVSGQCTAPTSIPIYDLIPRDCTSPNSLANAVFPIANSSGMLAGNEYAATFAGGDGGVTVQLTTLSGGGGSVAIDTSIINGTFGAIFNAAGTGMSFYDGPLVCYVNSAPMETHHFYFWLEGSAN